MKKLLKGGTVLNVFTGELKKTDVLISGEKIIGVDNYSPDAADICEDVSGKIICPGFIDGHIHIESTMLTPSELSSACLSHGTTAIVADPHEIANVCGVPGIKYMLEASEDLPLCIFFTLPSCVPATGFDESGAVLTAADIKDLYKHHRVVGLAEMMNYPGVIFGDEEVLAKMRDAKEARKVIDGHAPALSGTNLDVYINAGVASDHECTNFEEAKEKIEKGLTIMIRCGSAAKDIVNLLPLFDQPYNHRCILATDDRHPADIINEGHIDNIIRQAVKNGKSAITAIQMATIQASNYFCLRRVGAIAPGYRADILVLNDLDSVDIEDVYTRGNKVVSNKKTIPIKTPEIRDEYKNVVYNSFNVSKFSPEDFNIEAKSKNCRVIEVIPGQLITKEKICEINWDKNGGIDLDRDILKLAVIERHKNTGHKGLGFIKGIGLKKGAMASSVSHDSHNIIVIGTNDSDMSIAANYIRENGGNVVVCDGEIIAKMPLPIAGLMSDAPCAVVAEENEAVTNAAYALGVNKDVSPFMNMAFVSLSVIPSLKMSTLGLVDVDKFKLVSLYC